MIPKSDKPLDKSSVDEQHFNLLMFNLKPTERNVIYKHFATERQQLIDEFEKIIGKNEPATDGEGWPTHGYSYRNVLRADLRTALAKWKETT